MVSILQRMRALRTLLAIRIGPGAAILPAEVTRIQLDFAYRINGGHRGARHFWRNFLPRLKYHNPAIPMTVNRTKELGGNATLTVHFTTPSDSTTTAITSSSISTDQVPQSTAPAATTRTQVIDMKDRSESEILARLMDVTKAKVVRATVDEQRLLKEIEEHKAMVDKDRAIQAIDTAKKKREKAIMAKAQGEVDALLANM